MRKRDDLEYDKKRLQIMDAALTVIAEKGFEKATNRDIARAAGVGSPGLIYHYFQDKGDLLRQAMEAHSTALQTLRNDSVLMSLPPRAALTMVGTSFAETLSDPVAVSVFRVMLSEALRVPAVAHVWSATVSGPGFRVLRRYLAAQMDAGVLRKMDAGAAVRCFIGPLLIYMLTREVLPTDDSETLTRETMVQTAVDIFLKGMEPQPAPRAAAGQGDR